MLNLGTHRVADSTGNQWMLAAITWHTAVQNSTKEIFKQTSVQMNTLGSQCA